MKDQIKKRWLEALRSGKYTQADSVLHDGKGFCCLGVLYDTELDTDWVQFTEDGMTDAGCYIYKGHWVIDENSTSLGDKFREQQQIEDWEQGVLMDMNDDGKDFPTIADWIEVNM